jgi:hypothetical protein
LTAMHSEAHAEVFLASITLPEVTT